MMQVMQLSSTPSESTFSKDKRLLLAGVVLADNLEKELTRYYKSFSAGDPLLIDFRKATFIDIAALINCIALLVDRGEKRFNTYLAYPEDRRVRDFMKVWRFENAVEKATSIRISDMLIAEHQQFTTEPQSTYSGHGDAINKLEFDPDWDPRKATSRNFFEFVTFAAEAGYMIAPDGRFAGAPREEGKKWTRPLIKQVLEKHLPGKTTKDEVARVIIYEALSNAVRHPRARTIQVVSKFTRPSDQQEGKNGSLRICVWDDGDGIANTLLEALNNGTIHAFHLPSYMCDKVHVTLRNFAKSTTNKPPHIVDQSERITKHNATEARVLLASLFPGITRTVVEKVPRVQPFEEKDTTQETLDNLEVILSSAPGMGLYSLTRTVLDQFRGSLFIRSGNYRLLIEMAHDTLRSQFGVRYKCKITGYEKYMPPFKGNLLSIQLPLRS